MNKMSPWAGFMCNNDLISQGSPTFVSLLEPSKELACNTCLEVHLTLWPWTRLSSSLSTFLCANALKGLRDSVSTKTWSSQKARRKPVTSVKCSHAFETWPHWINFFPKLSIPPSTVPHCVLGKQVFVETASFHSPILLTDIKRSEAPAFNACLEVLLKPSSWVSSLFTAVSRFDGESDAPIPPSSGSCLLIQVYLIQRS